MEKKQKIVGEGKHRGRDERCGRGRYEGCGGGRDEGCGGGWVKKEAWVSRKEGGNIKRD